MSVTLSLSLKCMLLSSRLTHSYFPSAYYGCWTALLDFDSASPSPPPPGLSHFSSLVSTVDLWTAIQLYTWSLPWRMDFCIGLWMENEVKWPVCLRQCWVSSIHYKLSSEGEIPRAHKLPFTRISPDRGSRRTFPTKSTIHHPNHRHFLECHAHFFVQFIDIYGAYCVPGPFRSDELQTSGFFRNQQPVELISPWQENSTKKA